MSNLHPSPSSYFVQPVYAPDLRASSGEANNLLPAFSGHPVHFVE